MDLEIEEVVRCVAKWVCQCNKELLSIKGAVEAKEPSEHPRANQYRQLLLDEFGESSLSDKYPKNPPVRGPFGEAEIWLKPDAVPVSIATFSRCLLLQTRSVSESERGQILSA